MDKDVRYSVSQVKTVVPAVQPAWVRLVFKAEVNGCQGYWNDEIMNVLAYGVATTDAKWEAAGFYLVADRDGPSWLDARGGRDSRVILSIGEKPRAGETVKGFTDECEYDEELDLIDDGYFNFIFE